VVRVEKAMSIAAIVVVELGLLYADGTLFIGVLIANNEPASWADTLAVYIMCTCDPICFVLSWFKPKVGATLLAISSGITLILCLIASDAHSLKALWFAGGVFWTIKFLLAYFLYMRPRGVVSSPANA
jgi:hypothetical protein